MYVHIEWIRHGMSCANIISTLKPLSLHTSKLAPDSLLSNIGVKQSQILNVKFFNKYSKFDLLCSSELRRSIETSEYAFKGIKKEIFILPYISELYLLKSLSQNSIPINKNYHNKNKKLNWDIFKVLDINEFKSPNIKKFNKIILPMLIYIAINKNKNIGTKKRPIKIAIVSHQKFIKKKLKTKLINNTGIQMEQLKFNKKIEKKIKIKTLYNPLSINFKNKNYKLNKKGLINKKDITKDMIERCENRNKIINLI